MLMKMVNIHPNIKIIQGETFFFFSLYGQRFPFFLDWNLINNYLNKQKQFIEKDWDNLTIEKWKTEFRESPKTKNYWADLYFALMKAFLKSQNYNLPISKVYLGAKNPPDIFHVKDLLRFFPESKFLNVIRDGRAVASSLLKIGWAGDILETAAEWKIFVEVADKLSAKLPENFQTIYYRNILMEPKITIEKICKFLDLPAEEKIITNMIQNFRSYNSSYNIEDYNSGIDQSRMAKWKKHLSKNEISAFESIAGDNLKEHNFAILTGLESKKTTKLLGRTKLMEQRVKLILRKMAILFGVLGFYIYLKNRFRNL